MFWHGKLILGDVVDSIAQADLHSRLHVFGSKRWAIVVLHAKRSDDDAT